MASIALPLLGLLSGGLSGLFGGKSQKATQSTDSTTTGSNAYNSNTSPVLSDFQEGLAKLFTTGLIDRYKQGPADLSGYAAGGLQDINRGADLKKQIVSNTLAQRGLSYSPAAATALAQPESERVGQGVDFMSQIPLLQRSLQQQDLQGLIQGFGALPTGQVSSGNTDTSSTTNGTTTSTGPSNMLGGLISGAASGGFAGYGAAQQGQFNNSLAAKLAALFGGK
jgi:hypothetical protein